MPLNANMIEHDIWQKEKKNTVTWLLTSASQCSKSFFSFFNSSDMFEGAEEANHRSYSAKAKRARSFFRHCTEPANASHSPIAEAAGRRIQRFRKGLPLSTMPYLVTRMNPGYGHLLSAAVTSKKRPHHRLLWYSATKGSAQSTGRDPRQTAPVKSEPAGLCCVFTAVKAGEVSRSNFSLLHANGG